MSISEMNEKKVLVVGAGLAGSEAAWFLANRGIKVILLECKSLALNPAQKMKTAAELVCTNSLKSKDPLSAHGLLKTEMKYFGSLVMEVGEETAVPAGDALAVDRKIFSEKIQAKLEGHENIEFLSEEVGDPTEALKKYNCDYAIIATGPLTTKPLENWMVNKLSKGDFYFYDAIAPVVDADSLDYSVMYFKDRYKDHPEENIEGTADYLNCPLTEEEYYRFIEELRNAEKVEAQDFEELKYFEACLPIDTMALRGVDTPRFSCMKPVGLEKKDGSRPFAVIQLRKENLLGSSYNLVGFQTRLKYGEQLRIFKTLPGFENAVFNHLGSVHRNSFLNSRKLLNSDLSSKEFPAIYFAGQITGVEGYTESASMGIYVASQVYRKCLGQEMLEWPVASGMGALVNYIMTVEKPSPSNINFALLPTVKLNKEQRKNPKRRKIKKSLAAQQAQDVFYAFAKDSLKELESRC